MEFEYRKKNSYLLRRILLLSPLFELEFISQHQVKKYDDRETEKKGGWNFSLFFRNWNVDSRKSLVSFIFKVA